jgi:c-di-GMP-binding flagellar brake protein YcgR
MEYAPKSKITNHDALLRFFQINYKIFIFILNENKLKTGTSTIKEFCSDYFLVSMPVFNSEIKIEKGVKLFFKILPPDVFFFEFTSNVLEIVTIDSLKHLKMAFPDFAYKYQRRETYRLPVSLSAKITLKTSINSPNDNFIKSYDIRLLDLSLGGALIACDFHLDNQSKGIISFNIEDNDKEIPLNFEVQRIRRLKTIKSKYLFHYGIKFTAMKEAFNQKLSKYIISNQLMAIRKLNM